MDIIINKSQEDRWHARWEQLRANRNNNDYEIAELMAAVRRVFPDGVAGNTQFVLFVKPRFRPSHSDTLLAKAQAFDQFPADEWRRYGGWAGIAFLIGLKSAQRKHLMRVLSDKKGPFNHVTLRQIARKLGLITERDKAARTEYKHQVVYTHLRMLMKTHPELPWPPEVTAALSAQPLKAATTPNTRAHA